MFEELLGLYFTLTLITNKLLIANICCVNFTDRYSPSQAAPEAGWARSGASGSGQSKSGKAGPSLFTTSLVHRSPPPRWWPRSWPRLVRTGSAGLTRGPGWSSARPRGPGSRGGGLRRGASAVAPTDSATASSSFRTPAVASVPPGSCCPNRRWTRTRAGSSWST